MSQDAGNHALEINAPNGPVVIRGNTFSHTGHQAQPGRYVYVQSPDPDDVAQGLVEYRDNIINSFHPNQVSRSDADNRGLIHIACRNQDRVGMHPNRCDLADVRVKGNTFKTNPSDVTAPTIPDSDSISMTIPYAAIVLSNIGHFLIAGNSQQHSQALANILVEYNNDQPVTVSGVIRDNLGHPAPEREVSPTIYLTSSDSRLPTTGSIQLGNNRHYTLNNQLTLPSLTILQSIISSSSALVSQLKSTMTNTNEEDNELNAGQITGIVVATVIGVLLVAAVIGVSIAVHVIGKKATPIH